MVTSIPNPLPPTREPGTPQLAVSKTAAAAVSVGVLPLIAAVIFGLTVFTQERPTEGMARFGQFLGTILTAYVILIGGTVCAVVSIILGGVALWRVRQDQSGAMRERRTALASISISTVSLLSAWGAAAAVIFLINGH